MTFTREKIEASAGKLGIILAQCAEGETPGITVGTEENKTFISYEGLQDDFRKNSPITKASIE